MKVRNWVPHAVVVTIRLDFGPWFSSRVVCRSDEGRGLVGSLGSSYPSITRVRVRSDMAFVVSSGTTPCTIKKW